MEHRHTPHQTPPTYQSEMSGGDRTGPRGTSGAEEPGIPLEPSYRYEDLGLIGSGGMGQVRRVRDRDLNCVVAMKIGHTRLMQDRQMLTRFISEAQATAQLCHPGIIPVHELGVLPDGRFFFTMKEVTGKTLRAAIGEAHADGGSALALDATWRIRRLVETFHGVCEAVGYAHARGVVHRDLKPDNVMLGEWGEVLVLDWGLAKVHGVVDHAPAGNADAVVTNRSEEPSLATRTGIVAGTPCYMPPEQARGEFVSLGPQADVYALGAILYEILHGVPPWSTIRRKGLVKHVAAGHELDARRSATHVPDVFCAPVDLFQICETATRPRVEDRYPHAGELADRVRAWLDGARSRDRALELVSRASALQRSVSMLRRQATAFRAESRDVDGVGGQDAAPEAWALEAEAERIELEVAQKEAEALTLLHSATLDVPNLDVAHQMLADHYRQAHALAEARRDVALAGRLEALVRSHDRGRHAAYLDGYGRVSLATDAPRTTVTLYRFDERGRRLQATALGRELVAPIVELSLPCGSYLFVLRADGRAEVRYPVRVDRLGHWTTIPPCAASPRRVHLPEPRELSDLDCYVPEGWFVSSAPGGDPAELWTDAFVIRRLPVSYTDYLAFLEDLVERGDVDLAEDFLPLDRSIRRGRRRLLELGPGARVRLTDPSDGPRPVTLLDAPAMEAYAAWYAERSGRPWRLPSEAEWEKAARGVDGRAHPWGNRFEEAFCRSDADGSAEDWPPRAPCPADESPYGVLAMAGGVMDLCRSDASSDGRWRVARGGSWCAAPGSCRVDARARVGASEARPDLGFRLARSVVVA